ncbi:hypothetical protein VPHD479_0024 [Vibrio phage D479]
MKKSELRRVMLAAADLGLNDEQAHLFIDRLVKFQHYSVKRAAHLFAVNAAIYYAGSNRNLIAISNAGGSVDDCLKWESDFIESVRERHPYK